MGSSPCLPLAALFTSGCLVRLVTSGNLVRRVCSLDLLDPHCHTLRGFATQVLLRMMTRPLAGTPNPPGHLPPGPRCCKPSPCLHTLHFALFPVVKESFYYLDMESIRILRCRVDSLLLNMSAAPSSHLGTSASDSHPPGLLLDDCPDPQGRCPEVRNAADTPS